MNDSFAKIKGIGELTYKRIYGFYDEPLLFSCVSITGSLYLLLRQPDEEPEWLAVEISEKRLSILESNGIEIRKAFVEPENGFAYRVFGNKTLFEAEVIMPQQITDDMLPYSGEYLDYQGDSESEREEIDIIAGKEQCAVIELSFEKDDAHEREISCTALSDALNSIQMLVYSLACKEEKTCGPFPKSVREQHELRVTETFAASFGIRLKGTVLDDEVKQEEANDVLERLDKLIEGSSSSKDLKTALSRENNRTAVNYNKLLRVLKGNNLGFKFAAASPIGKYSGRHLSTVQVGEVLQRITNEIQDIKKEEIYEGELKGIDIEKNQFTFIPSGEGEDIRISGKISENLSKKTFMVPSKTSVRVETKISFDKRTGEEKYSFLLLDVNDV